MRRLGGWLTGGGIPAKPLLQQADELSALEEALQQSAWAMNDEVVRSQEELEKGTTPFHKLAYGATLFWQAVLGFDKVKLAIASAALAEAEQLSAEHLRMAQRDPTSCFQSKIYPAGAEYSVVQCQCLLLSAILGILNDSWLEALVGLNKLRKAYFAIQALVAAENRYVAAHPPSTPIRLAEDGQGFADTEETLPNGSASVASSIKSGGTTAKQRRKSSALNSKVGVDFRTISAEPIDLFIHAGITMPWGIIQIVISLVPPAFRHILSMFNFRGERDDGIALLWDASTYRDNIFGAIAGLVILLYHNIAIALADILTVDAVPEARLKELLSGLRTMYPDSQLWVNEEARIASWKRDLETSAKWLDVAAGPSFPELQGLRLFEKSLDLLFLHQFEEAIECWKQTIKMNAWSPGMYGYIAAACYIEMYRDHQTTDPGKAKTYAEKAKELLEPVPALVSKKALLGQQLPFDAFIQKKLIKWEARARSQKCDLLDAIGVSPVEEMSYFWTGYRRMNAEQLQVSLDRLAKNEQLSTWNSQPADEKASLALFQGIALRGQGKVQEAKVKFQQDVFCYTKDQIKSSPHAQTYPLPIGHYERSVCFWQEFGGEDASPAQLRQVREEMEKCNKWEHYDLDDRMVVKISTAKETLTKLGV